MNNIFSLTNNKKIIRMLQVRINFCVCSRRFLQLNSTKKVTKGVNEIALKPKIHHGLESSILFASNLSTIIKKKVTVKFNHLTDARISLHSLSTNKEIMIRGSQPL